MNQWNFAELNGVELHLDDFEFMHNAFKDVLSPLVQALGGTSRIGGNIAAPSGGGFIYASGWLLHTSEIFRINEGIITPATIMDNLYYALLETFHPDGSELNEPGAPIETYISRTAILKKASSIVDGEADPDFLCWYGGPDVVSPTPTALVALQKYLQLEGSLITVGSSAPGSPAWSVGESAALGFPVSFYRIANVVYMQGRVNYSGAGTPIFQLPTGYRPAADRIQPIAIPGDAGDTATAFIGANGFVGINLNAPAGIYCLDGISFRRQ
jgi:hypothetical protein